MTPCQTLIVSVLGCKRPYSTKNYQQKTIVRVLFRPWQVGSGNGRFAKLPALAQSKDRASSLLWVLTLAFARHACFGLLAIYDTVFLVTIGSFFD